MQYLNSPYHRDTRKDPARLESWVRSIICLGWSYDIHFQGSKEKGWLAGYTSGEDYHLLLHRKMEELAEYIQQAFGTDTQIRGFTDSAPLLERELASRAGLGWIGKNGCLISPIIGSGFLLAELFVNISLQPDPPFLNNYCGTCTRCLEACPTACIQPDRTLDSSRCLSFLTIENKGTFPQELLQFVNNWFFGCDACQSVCPWNKKFSKGKTDYYPADWEEQQIISVLRENAQTISRKYRTSALSRAKWKGLARNALVFLGNHPNPEASQTIRSFMQANPYIYLQQLAAWAFKRNQSD